MTSSIIEARRLDAVLVPEERMLPPGASIEVPGLTLPERLHEETHVLLWLVRGEASAVVDDVTIPITTGSALWIPCSSRHRVTTERNSVLLPMFFDAGDAASALDHPVLVPIDETMQPLCLTLIGSYYSIIRPPADVTRMVLSLVRAQLVVPDGLSLPDHPLVARIARTIVLDPGDRRSLQDWADELHFSRRSLERIFVRETGRSWAQWRLACRMETAAKLLLLRRSTIAVIAHRVGYDTHSAFTRAFRDYHGASPSAHVRMAEEARQPAGTGADTGSRRMAATADRPARFAPMVDACGP